MLPLLSSPILNQILISILLDRITVWLNDSTILDSVISMSKSISDESSSSPFSGSVSSSPLFSMLHPNKIELKFCAVDEIPTEGEAIATSISDTEPYVGMEFESEESAKVFYDLYASRFGFIMRVDAFRRSMRDVEVVWHRLVFNKEGFCKLRPKSENRKARAVTREGCKAMLVVKKDKTGKWVGTKFVKDHKHPLIVAPASSCRNVLYQTRNEKDAKIRELTAELQRERRRCAAYQEQLAMVLRYIEEHSNHLARNIDALFNV